MLNHVNAIFKLFKVAGRNVGINKNKICVINFTALMVNENNMLKLFLNFASTSR